MPKPLQLTVGGKPVSLSGAPAWVSQLTAWLDKQAPHELFTNPQIEEVLGSTSFVWNHEQYSCLEPYKWHTRAGRRCIYWGNPAAIIEYHRQEDEYIEREAKAKALRRQLAQSI